MLWGVPSKPLREPTYLILLALADQPRHGYGIIQTVAELSDGRTNLGPGTLYGALDRLAADGSIEPDHDEVVDGRLRRYYRITQGGRKIVADETVRLTTLAARATDRLGGIGGLPGGAGAMA
jgi:DNA-binding PadR family transcriptional regulator